MEHIKEVHYEILTALEHLDEVYRCIDNAIALSIDTTYLQDILGVAERNLGVSKMKLLVASDITESII
jgi:hypothetical protein